MNSENQASHIKPDILAILVERNIRMAEQQGLRKEVSATPALPAGSSSREPSLKPRKSNRRSTITEDELPSEQQHPDQSTRSLTITSKNPSWKVHVRNGAEMKASVQRYSDQWYQSIRDYVADFEAVVTEADEALESNEQLTQEVQQLQAASQEMEANHQDVKLKNKQLTRKNNGLRNEIKALREGPPSESENDGEENNPVELERNTKTHRPSKYTPKYSDPTTLTDGKDPLYEDWKLSVEDKLSANKDWWPTPVETARVILTWTGGKASKHLNARRRHEPNVFAEPSDVFECLDEIFKDHDRERKARRDFIKLKMESGQTFADFYSEFILLANQLRNATEGSKMEDLGDKITEELKLATANSGTFDSLLDYKKHLQSTYIKLSHIESESQSSSKAAAKAANRAGRTARTTDVLLRMLPKTKFHTDVEKEALKNLTNYSSHSQKCWGCGGDHLLADCPNPTKKTRWVQKRFKTEVASLQEANDDSDVQVASLKAKASGDVASDTSESESERIPLPKN